MECNGTVSCGSESVGSLGAVCYVKSSSGFACLVAAVKVVPVEFRIGWLCYGSLGVDRRRFVCVGPVTAAEVSSVMLRSVGLWQSWRAVASRAVF